MPAFRRAVPLLALVGAACYRDNPRAMDESLRQDLSLAARPPYEQQFVSPVELGYDAYGRPVYQQPAYRGPTPVVARQAPRVVRRAPASTTSGGGTYGGEVRNTQRDAILGAAAGAAIGMASSRDRLKGAVIGAAAGGVLGAIYGQKVDVNRPRD